MRIVDNGNASTTTSHIMTSATIPAKRTNHAPPQRMLPNVFDGTCIRPNVFDYS